MKTIIALILITCVFTLEFPIRENIEECFIEELYKGQVINQITKAAIVKYQFDGLDGPKHESIYVLMD